MSQERAQAFQVFIDDTGEVYPCKADQTLLTGMERLGRKGIPVGCRGGGCGVCKVHVTAGEVTCKRMSRAHVSPEEEARGIVLACRCRPQSDIRLAVIGKMDKAFFKHAQAATGRPAAD